jgi:hypothetical protein
MTADDAEVKVSPYLMCAFIPTIYILFIKVRQGKDCLLLSSESLFIDFRHHWSERCVGFSQELGTVLEQGKSLFDVCFSSHYYSYLIYQGLSRRRSFVVVIRISSLNAKAKNPSLNPSEEPRSSQDQVKSNQAKNPSQPSQQVKSSQVKSRSSQVKIKSRAQAKPRSSSPSSSFPNHIIEGSDLFKQALRGWLLFNTALISTLACGILC